MKNYAAAFIRENGPLKSFEPHHPYYLTFHAGEWFVQDSKSFNDNVNAGWVKIATEGKALRYIFYYCEP